MNDLDMIGPLFSRNERAADEAKAAYGSFPKGLAQKILGNAEDSPVSRGAPRPRPVFLSSWVKSGTNFSAKEFVGKAVRRAFIQDNTRYLTGARCGAFFFNNFLSYRVFFCAE